MTTKWIAFLVFMYMLAALAGGVMEGTMFGHHEVDVLNNISSYAIVKSSGAAGITEIVGSIPDFFTNLFNTMTFNYAMFQGDWSVVRLILCAPLIAAAVWGIISIFFSILQRTF